jgi:hypothetical protein
VWGAPVTLDDPTSVPLDDQPVRFDPTIALDGIEERGDACG